MATTPKKISVADAKQSGYFYANTTDDTTKFSTIKDAGTVGDSIQVAGVTSVSASQPTKIWVGTTDDVSVGGFTAATTYLVSGGSGDDQYDMSAVTSKGNQVTLGSGADSISLGANTTVTLGAGKDVVSVHGTGNTLTDYDYTEDHLNLGANVTKISVDNLKTSGAVSIDASTVLTVNAVSGGNFYAITAADATNANPVTYAWGGKNGSTIDLRGDTLEKPATIFGTANGDKGDLIIGTDYAGDDGTAGDSIIAGKNDSVFGGAGNDSISIAGDNVTVALFDQNFYGKVTGQDSVGNFDTGWDSKADAVYVMNTDGLASTSVGATSLLLHATEVNVNDSSDNRSTLILTPTAASKDDSLNVKINVAGTVKQAQFVGGSTTNSSINDKADIYVATAEATGNDSVIVKKGTSRTAVNMSNWGNDFIGDTTQYLVSSEADIVIDATEATQSLKLVGSSNSDSIKVGTAASSVWGGFGGDDSIVLTASKADGAATGTRTAADDVFFGTTNGNDTIDNFTSLDTITLYDPSQQVSSITKAHASTDTPATDTLTVKFADNSSLTFNNLADSVNIKTQIGVNGSTMDLQIGGTHNFTANDGKVADYYYVTEGVGTSSITVTDDANTSLWLAGDVTGIDTTGVNKASLVFADEANYTGTLIDAHDANGDVVLAGSSTNDTIKGSKGHSTLFGGTGDDVLVGDESSVGITTFLYGKGQGNDTIWTNNKSDKITLYDVAYADIATYEIDNTTNGALNVTLTDGSKLTVQNFGTKGTNSITLTDCTVSYDYTTEKWTKA